MTDLGTPELEASVIGSVLGDQRVLAEVASTTVMPEHFTTRAYREIYQRALDAFYDDEPTDALSIANRLRVALAQRWKCNENDVITAVRKLVEDANPRDAVGHASMVKRHFDLRELARISRVAYRDATTESGDPEKIAARLAQEATSVATNALRRAEIISHGELGVHFVRQQKLAMEAKAKGIDPGVYFGLRAFDDWIKGIRPTELFYLGGPPAGGKSGVAYELARAFARRQKMTRPEGKRVAALVISLEMGEEPTGGRLASSIGTVDGGRLREATNSAGELQRIADNWQDEADLSLYWNFASGLTSSQMRALVNEAVRRHNVGFVVIDHLRYFRMEGRFYNKMEEEEEKSRWLKEHLAKNMNLAVMCIAHTTKYVESPDGRPNLAALRGSGQLGADADFVCFVYRPYDFAKQEEIELGQVRRTDLELLWAKARHSITGTSYLKFDATTMNIADRIAM